MKEIIIYYFAFFLVAATFLPFANNKHWFFRNFDFVRLQILFLMCCSFLSILLFLQFNLWSIVSLIALFIAIIVQLKIISPYINLSKNNYKSNPPNKQVIKLLSSNVYQENNNYSAFLQLVKDLNPDIILAMETDTKWVENLKSLEQDYPHFKKVPFDNTYGMCFYSKLKTKSIKTHFFLQDDRPTIEALLQTENNQEFVFFGIHPPPPSPTEEKTSKEKDGELMLIAKHIRILKLPIIAAGDFNNVCWSKIAHLFAKVSNLNDCRINKGFFSTFPVSPFFLRFPLDLMYSSNGVQVTKMLVKENIDSDHLPFYSEFWIDENENKNNEALEEETISSTKDIIQEGKEEAE